MERRSYSRPRMIRENFTPQEYVALCIYGGENGLYGAWEDTNGCPGMQQTDVTCSNTSNSQYLIYVEGSVHTGPDQWGQYTIKQDKLYHNEDGWIYIRLKDETYPHIAADDPYFSLYHGGDRSYWYWESDDGRTFYMQWKPAKQYYNNFS